MKKIFLILFAIGLLSYTVINTFDGVVQYSRNFASSYTIRSLPDKGYVDSSRNKARDSVTTLLSAYKTITAYNSDTTAKTWDWADVTGKPSLSGAQSKAVTIEFPTASENMLLFYTDVAITVTKVADVLQGTSPSVTYDIVFSADASSGSPSELFGTDRTLTSTSGSTTTSFTDATIPAGWVRILTSAQSGTVTGGNVTIIYTID